MTSTGNIFVICFYCLLFFLFTFLVASEMISISIGKIMMMMNKDVDDDNIDDDVNLSHHLGNDVDGDGEDDCTVVLRGDAVQGLEVPQLEKE